MFASLRDHRLQEERSAWRRVQERGKTSFLFRTTIATSSVGFSLTYLILRLHQIGRSHGLAILVLSYIACLALGYLISEHAWRRGIRLISQVSAANS
jgi:hypothetical protein